MNNAVSTVIQFFETNSSDENKENIENGRRYESASLKQSKRPPVNYLRDMFDDKYENATNEHGLLYVRQNPTDSGSGRRRASHEDSLLQPNRAITSEIIGANRSRSSPARRRHSQGSVMAANNVHWSGSLETGLSVPGSCETTLADIMESPSRTPTMEPIAIPIKIETLNEHGIIMSPSRLSAHEPFGTPCGNSPLPATPLPFVQKDTKNLPPTIEEGDGKAGMNGDGDGYYLSEGHTSRDGLDTETLMFRDGRRRIDMILAYEEDNLGVMTEAESKKTDQRRLFQSNLIKEGLELELENKCLSFDEKTWFLKIHIPWKTEARYAEVMGLKLPIKRFITISVKAWEKDKSTGKETKLEKLRSMVNNFLDWNHDLIEAQPSFYKATAPRSGSREEQFLVKDRFTSYTAAQRSLLVMQILLRAKYDSTEKMGIRRLLNDGTYTACYPLHEGDYIKQMTNGETTDRRLLYLEWAHPSKWYKRQPLWLIRKYFGDKIALYFYWLGFYTKMLYPPAIVGTLCFMYGLLSMDSEDNIPTKEICDVNGPGSIILCPQCDKACKYQKLSDSCLFARLTYLFDNPATVFFAIFMSFWATSFLELWKRKQSVIVWEWDLSGVDQDEEPRPEFETSVKTFRINPVTREKEPYLPLWSRAMRFALTGSAILFMISIVLAAVLGTIIYRISIVPLIYGGGDMFIQRHAKIFTSISAAIINLIIIMILTRFYAKLAINLTNMENPRTQTEYEDSYTFKIFFFEFINFYASLIYIAFFKGRFFEYPGDAQARHSEFFKLKGDICDPAGCLSELCIQLAIIMIGKQCFNNFLEILNPKFKNWWRQRNHFSNTKDKEREHQAWEKDYHLQDPGRMALFDEYLEMVLQYGFVTLFVAAFPLAPLFALLNNIVEIRLDAYKMVTQARRPLAERVEDIGAWYGILKGITYAAVVTNAFVIAYTSDFIPRMVFKYVYSYNSTLIGYIDHSLSVFNTSDYLESWGIDRSNKNITSCQYRGYRNGPEDTHDPYGLSPHYWHVFAARLAFVVVFEHIVFGLTGLMQYVIPGIPTELKTQKQREALLAKEAKYEHGLRKGSETEYDQLMKHIRQTPVTNTTGGVAGSWARRLSKISDGLDAHVTVSQRPRASLASVAAAAWQHH